MFTFVQSVVSVVLSSACSVRHLYIPTFTLVVTSTFVTHKQYVDELGNWTSTKAVFDLTESRFRFIVSPDSDSLANRMDWIRWRGPWTTPTVCSVTSLLFVHIGDAAVTSFTSGFASKSASKLDSLNSRIRIRIRALNGQFHRIRPESRFGFGKSNTPKLRKRPTVRTIQRFKTRIPHFRQITPC